MNLFFSVFICRSLCIFLYSKNHIHAITISLSKFTLYIVQAYQNIGLGMYVYPDQDKITRSSIYIEVTVS